MADGVVFLPSGDDLVKFLEREPLRDRVAEFRDTLFEIYERRGSLTLGVEELIPVGIEIETSLGWYARIWVRPPLALDLLVEPREFPEPGRALEARFDIAAANREYALRRLTPLAPTLVSLGDRYGLELRDDRLELGPLELPSRELAADLALLIDALAGLTREDDDPEPDTATFCHFCGHGVAEDTAICPRCQERLLDD